MRSKERLLKAYSGEKIDRVPIHNWRTRPDPFEDDWPWVQEQLEENAGLEANGESYRLRESRKRLKAQAKSGLRISHKTS